MSNFEVDEEIEKLVDKHVEQFYKHAQQLKNRLQKLVLRSNKLVLREYIASQKANSKGSKAKNTSRGGGGSKRGGRGGGGRRAAAAGGGGGRRGAPKKEVEYLSDSESASDDYSESSSE